MPASEWTCRLNREVSPGMLTVLASVAGAAGLAERTTAQQQFATVNNTSAFLAPVLANGQEVIGTASIEAHRGEIWVADWKVTNPAGDPVMIGQPTFLTTSRATRHTAAERVLLSVLFTDLVDSTAQARRVGDARWRDLLQEHHALIRRQLVLHRGHEVKTMGDGFLATFESPTRAALCALAIRNAVDRLDLEIRAGIHTGECEVTGGDLSGLAVNVAARVESAAQPGEILVSRTVRELADGSGLVFSDRGVHALKGLEGEWHLYALDG
jgi:class 3 adenylate cyclase